MSDGEKDTAEVYTRFDIVVRHDGRDRVEIWNGLEDVLCPGCQHDAADEACAIEWMSSMTDTLDALKALNARMGIQAEPLGDAVEG